MTRSRKLLFFALIWAAAGCSLGESGESAEVGGPTSSLLRVDLPALYLSGYAEDLRGEVLQYHSPVPLIGTSLLVRSEDRNRSISWESQALPDDLQENEVTLALMVGIDVHQEPRSYDLRVNEEEAFSFRNPTEARVGDTLRWQGEGGVRGEFQVTLIDRYGDAMGFLFLTIPRRLVEPGRPVRFQVLGESAGVRTWFMVFRDGLKPFVELQNAPAVLRTSEGEAQIIRLDVLVLNRDLRFRLESPIGEADTILPLGHTRLTLPVPAVSGPEPMDLRIAVGDFADEVTYTVQPPRRMEIYLLHHTHLDIGYTHHQDEVERIQWASLEEALRLGEASEANPEGSRFVWNPEGIWAVDTYVRAHPGEKTDRLMEGIRRGWIELDGMYAGLLTGLANEEVLRHSLDATRALSEMSGVPVESEMLSDIPGFTWGLVEALAESGIRYLSIGPNFGHRIGHLTEELGDRPFYWEGPSGESRLLTWVSGGGYALFHTGLGYDSITARIDEEKVFGYVDQLVAQDYPYDITHLRYNIGSDNGPPDPGLAEAVLAWNQRYSSPVLRISGTTEAFRAFEDRYGSGLPTHRGDLTGHWEDGAGSSARETALVRRVAEALPQTEGLARMRGIELDPPLLEEAWRNVLLFYEHTWGSWNSVSEPYADLTVTSWERKKAFAEEAVSLADRLRAQALGEGTGIGAEGPATHPALTTSPDPDGSRTIEVFNTLPWSRTDLVVLPPEETLGRSRILNEDGVPVPSQRLSMGDLAFLASNVPGGGVTQFTLQVGEPFPGVAEDGPGIVSELEDGFDSIRGDVLLTTSLYSVVVDGGTGNLPSVRHEPSGRELAQAGNGGLNQYLYVPGRDPARAVGSGPAEVRWKEAGPLLWSVEVVRPGPGLRERAVSEIRVVEGLDRVEILNTIAKAWVLEPEAVLFRFPFALEDPEVRIDVPFGFFRPEVDQVPGASKNYYSVQRWVDLSDSHGGVTVTTVDAPLIQLGEVRTDAIVTGWLDRAEPSPTLLSYVMNNYWETNYRAAQDDEVTFRYAFRAHGPFQAMEADRFSLEVARPLIARVR